MKTCLILSCLGVLLTFNGCKKPEAGPTPPVAVSCGNNPTEELKWLKDLIQEALSKPKIFETGIFKTQWRGETLLVVYRAGSSCYLCEAYYCDGSKLDVKGMTEDERGEYYEVVHQLQLSDLIWKSTN